MLGPSNSELVTFISQLPTTCLHHPFITHALQIRNSLLSINYYQFFSLYYTAPNMSGYLLDPLAIIMRERACRIIISAYRPKLLLKHMAIMLGFAMETAGEEENNSSNNSNNDDATCSVAALQQCHSYLVSTFPNSIIFSSSTSSSSSSSIPPLTAASLSSLSIDCKQSHDNLAITNHLHRGALHNKHTRLQLSHNLTATQANTQISSESIEFWMKKDNSSASGNSGVSGSGGKIVLGRVEGSPVLAGQPISGVTFSFPSLPARSSSSATTIRSLAHASPLSASPSPSPSPPPPSVPSLPPTSSSKSKSLSSMSWHELKSEIDALAVALTEKKEEYDNFTLLLMQSKMKALAKQLKKTKK